MHAQKFVVAACACHVLPDDVPWEVGVLISGDGLGVPYHSSTRMPQTGVDSVAVFGLGPVGLGSVLLQTYLGRRVVGVDVSQYRLDYAMKLGARWSIPGGKPTTVQEVQDFRSAGQVPQVPPQHVQAPVVQPAPVQMQPVQPVVQPAEEEEQVPCSQHALT